jgi:hypothetical protein
LLKKKTLTDEQPISYTMVFLRSRSNTNNPKTVVITVNLPEDINLLEPMEDSDLCSVTKSVSSTNTEERKSRSRLLQIFSFLQGSQKDDDDGSTQNNTSSEGSLSSRSQGCVDSLHEEMEGTFSEIIVRSKSAENDSYSLHGFDDRDDLLNEENEDNPDNTKGSNRDESFDGYSDIERDVMPMKSQTHPPIPTYKSSFTKNELPVNKLQNVPNFCAKTKPLSLRELRRTASNGSKNYVHVFHNQLKPLVEKPSEDNYENDETVSDGESNGDIIQRPSFSASFDETEIRKRWTLSLEVMAKWGLAS